MTKAQINKLKKKGWTPKTYEDKCQLFADSVIEGIESSGKWVRTWTEAEIGGLPSNYQSNTEYSGLNQLACMGRMMREDYKFNKWVTFKGAEALGGSVKKDERKNYLHLCYYNVTLFDENGKKIPQGNPDKLEVSFRRAFMNTFVVYNIEQCEGIDMPKPLKKKKRTLKPLKEMEALVKNFQKAYPSVKISIKESNRAYCIPSRDEIVMPLIDQCVDWSVDDGGTILEGKHNWWRILLHEMGHLLQKRVAKTDDDIIPDNFFRNHKDDYAYEELCAELYSVFVGIKLGISYGKNMENSKEYVVGWLSQLKNNPQWIVEATKDSMKRVNLWDKAVA